MSIDIQEVYLRHYPDPCLSKKCRDIDPNDPDLPIVLDKMVAIMRTNGGIGLAAPQVGLDWNVFVVEVKGEEQPRAIINPKIEQFGEKKVKTQEGCLSLPGVAAKLEDVRHEQITVSCCMPKSTDRITVALEGGEAIIFQHEYDHLQGKVLFDRMKQVSKMMAKKKYLKSKAKNDKIMKDFVRLRTSRAEVEKVLKKLEETKHGKPDSPTKDGSSDITGRADSSPGLTTANTTESSAE